MKVSLPIHGLHGQSHARGIGVYAKELLKSLQKLFPHDHFYSTANQYVASHPDLIHYPFFDPFFLTLHLDRKVPTLVTIHDLIPLKFPLHFKTGIRGKLKWLIQSAKVKRATHIITDSECSKSDIVEILGFTPSSVSVIPLGPSIASIVPKRLATQIRKDYHLPAKYLLYVGDINWNKNVVGLIECFNHLADPSYSLVLVGKVFTDKPDIEEYHSIANAISHSPKAKQILTLGYIPNHQLGAIYAGATLYVQPSFYEGFGLPVLEAMKFGCPVATSNRGSLGEIGGTAVAYFDPDNSMVKVINTLLGSPSERERLRGLGLLRAKQFSWAKTAELTHAVYEKILTLHT